MTKRMTDEDAQMLRSNIWIDDGITAFDKLMEEFSRARAREARLAALVERTVRGFEQGYKLTPAEVAAMREALEGGE